MQVDYCTVVSQDENFANKKSQDKIRDEINVKKDNGEPYFPKEVVDQAYYIYTQKMTNIGSHRKIKRIQLCYILITYAYRELNIVIDNDYIRESFKLSVREAKRANIEFSPLQTGYTIPKKDIDYNHYLNIYMQKLDITADINPLIEFIENKCNLLKINDLPQYYAAALLNLYVQINNATLTDELHNILCLNYEKLCNEIKRVDFVYYNDLETINNKICITN
jgi:hypothetical protein